MCSHSGIPLQGPSHPKSCLIFSPFFGFNIAGDSADGVHYSLVEAFTVEVAINRVFGLKNACKGSGYCMIIILAMIVRV